MLSRLPRIALAPLWVGQLATRSKSFIDNPIIGSRRLNEWGLHARRVALAHRLAGFRRRRLAGLISAADRAAYERDGFVLKRDFLPAAAFAALRDGLGACRGRFREVREGDTILRKIAIDARLLADVPALADLVRSPEWLGLIRYIGARGAAPTATVQSIERYACDGPEDPQTLLHADTFHPTVKAWLFLTDVAADAGAFTYVPGSHRLTPQRLLWERRLSLAARHSAVRDTREGSFRVDPAELPLLGLPAPRILAVPRNTLIVADTFGFHARGPCTDPALRVAIWATLPRQPFLPWAFLPGAAPIPGGLAAWRTRLARGGAAARSDFSPFDSVRRSADQAAAGRASR